MAKDDWSEIVGGGGDPNKILGELLAKSPAFAAYAKKRAAANRPVLHGSGGISITDDEQTAAIPEYRDVWTKIFLSTAVVDRAAAEAAIRDVYARAEKKAPKKILWCRSPMEGVAEAVRCVKSGDAPWWRTGFDGINFSLPSTLDLYKSVVPAVGCEVSNRVGSHYNDAAEKLAQQAIEQAHFGSHDAPRLCLVDFAGQVLGNEDCAKLSSIVAVARSCGWTWMLDKIAIVTERPSKLMVDEKGALHCVDGQAVEYADGFGVCVWHGTRVPHAAITDPDAYPWDAVAETADKALQDALADLKSHRWAAGREDFYDAAQATKIIGGVDAVKKLVES